MKRKNNGVTLIALVVTIVVLIILAGISIATLSGNNGVITQANKAKIKTEILDIKEQFELEEIKREELGKQISFGTIKSILGIDTAYEDILIIESGKLVYTENASTVHEECFEELGISEQTKDSYWIVNEENVEEYKKIEGIEVGSLEDFRDLVNAGTFEYTNACLGEDIVLDYNSDNQYTPIGTSLNKFSKIFDGKNYTISGIYIDNTSLNNQALFAYNTGTIKNVGIKNSYINAGSYVSALVAQNWGNIENCYNESNVSGNESVGGIVGYVFESIGETHINIQNCYNTGTITGANNYIGGIAGLFSRGTTSNIQNCYNTGKITGTGWIGGIIGYANIKSNNISNCNNKGYISGDTSIGGIAGAVGSSSSAGTINACYNLSDITCTGNSCGGIVGTLVSPNENKTGSSIISCYNLADFIGDSTRKGHSIGGIVGNITYSNVINSYTTSRVEGYIIVGVAVGQSRYGPTYVDSVYYLERADNNNYVGIGRNATNLTGEITSLTEIYMKSQDFVDDLNESISEQASDIGWKYNSGKYPTF